LVTLSQNWYIEKNFRAILQGALGKMDLVTREEFEVQKGVLAKTRSKLEDLENRVAEMEQQILKSQAAQEEQ
jgi:BMFP domain-containing protein YqiC